MDLFGLGLQKSPAKAKVPDAHEKCGNKDKQTSAPCVASTVQRCRPDCRICILPTFLDKSWHALLGQEFEKDYMQRIIAYLHTEDFYPPVEKIFTFSKFFGPSGTRVVILGQDPYHNAGQATGLAFSVPLTERIPPSLKNIFKEIKDNYNDFTVPAHGNLSEWAAQGVLLLNDSLTVKKNTPNSHSNIGWQHFTHHVISALNTMCNHLVFMLWGSNAQKKHVLIDKKRHLVLMAAHPSPFSADRGFFGSKHFVKANNYLVDNSLCPIDWTIAKR